MSADDSPVSNTHQSRWTLGLCAGASFLEGFNNQTLGVVAPKLFLALQLTPAQGAWVFSASTAGLAIGALGVGRLADRVGRKPVLLLSMALFGVCSLLTVAATDLRALLIVRLLTGIGVGGAMPTAIAIAAEAARPARRLMMVALVSAGLPLGGAVAGLLSLAVAAGWSWHLLFYAGGVAPLVLLLPTWRYLLASAGAYDAVTVPGAPQRSGPPPSLWSTLWGAGRGVTTLQLWVAFFFLHLILFLLLNWLPSLFIGLGFTRSQASWSAFWFNLCGALAGIALARLQSGAGRVRWGIFSYIGMLLALLILASSRSFLLAAMAVALAGTFVIGAQLVLYAMAPLYYPPAGRATGVGAALALARCGSVVGPLFAGWVLESGGSSSTVLVGVLPFVILSGLAVLLLARRRYAE